MSNENGNHNANGHVNHNDNGVHPDAAGATSHDLL